MISLFFIIAVLFLLVFPPRVYAYLDPGSGSYIIQVIIAALLGGIFMLKTFWGRIKSSLGKIFSNRKKVDEE